MKTKKQDPTGPRLAVKIREASELLGVSTSSIRRLIQRGEIQVIRKFRHPLVPVTELQKLINQLSQ
jgi:excisionase family DNA binding protein